MAEKTHFTVMVTGQIESAEVREQRRPPWPAAVCRRDRAVLSRTLWPVHPAETLSASSSGQIPKCDSACCKMLITHGADWSVLDVSMPKRAPNFARGHARSALQFRLLARATPFAQGTTEGLSQLTRRGAGRVLLRATLLASSAFSLKPFGRNQRHTCLRAASPLGARANRALPS